MTDRTLFEGLFFDSKSLQMYSLYLSGISSVMYMNLTSEFLCLYTSRKEYQVWVEISTRALFSTTSTSNEFLLELSSDSFGKVLQSDTGTSNVHLLIQEKSNNVFRLAIKIDSQQDHGLNIRQRIFASPLPTGSIPHEPVEETEMLFCRLHRKHLAQLGMVSDRFKTMASHITLILRRDSSSTTSTELTLACEQHGFVANVSMNVSSVQEDTESSSQLDNPKSVTIRVKDWCHMLQLRKYADDLVVGISHEQMVTMFWQSPRNPDDHRISLYLFQSLD